jgi:hypothetical protein
MRKKRNKKFQHKKRERRPARGQSKFQAQTRENDLTQQVLTLLYKNKKPLHPKEILQQLNLPLADRKPLHNLLTRLSGEKILKQVDKDL